MALPINKSWNGLYGTRYLMLISDRRLATNFTGGSNGKWELIR